MHPLYYMGFVVLDFLKKRQKARKFDMKEHQLPCFKCRKGVMPQNNEVKIVEGRITGICELCGCEINSFAPADLTKIRKIFTITEES
jgi:hypothetical protein